MKLPKIMLCLLVLLLAVSLAFSFNVKNYLYPDEDENSLSTSTILLGEDEYKLVNLDTKTIFLTEDGEPVEEKEEIELIIYAYYKENNYATEEEINELINLVEQYNHSRYDNGSLISGLKEEKLCKASLFMLTVSAGNVLDLFPCYDDESCDYTALMFCSAVGEQPFSMCRPDEVVEDMKYLSYASIGTDALLNNFSEKLTNYNEATLYDNLVYMKDNLDELETYAEHIEASVFQTPAHIGDGCYLISMDATVGCYQICGVLDLDHETLIPEMEEKLDTLIEKIEPFSQYSEKAESIYTETHERIQYKLNSELKEEYLSEYGPMYEHAQEVILIAEDTTNNKVINQSLKNSMYELQELVDDINQSLNNLNLTNIEDKFDDLDDLINKTESKLNSTLELYNDTMNAKSEAELSLFILSMTSLDPSLEQELLEIEEQKNELDENLSKTVPTASKMQEINKFYHSVDDALSAIKEKQSENILFMQMRTFARSVNSNINALLISMDNLDYEKRLEYSQWMPIGLSVVNFIAMSCFGMFVFLFAVSRIKPEVKKKNRRLFMFIGLLFLFVILTLIFSVGFYFYLDKTTNSADFNEFVLALSSHNTTAIVVNFTNVSSSDSYSMETCAAALAEIIESKNKTVNIYIVDENKCTKNNETLENITSENFFSETNIADPIFYLGYSSIKERPKVISIFLDQLTLKGDKEYYDTCVVASIFHAVEFEDLNKPLLDIDLGDINLDNINVENITSGLTGG